MGLKKKGNFRKIINTLHLWLGLPSGLIVFIVGITGALFVFEEEGRQLFQHEYYHVQNVGTERLSVKQMTDTFKVHYPKDKITSIRFTEEKDAAFIFISKKDFAVSIDPYTAKIIGVRNLDKDFFSVVQELHTHLLMGKVGNEIIRWNVLIFFIMCISGLILWWPKQKRFFKQAATINFKTRNFKRFNWDLHSVLGFYALAVLLIISSTGLFWMFDTTKKIVGFITNSPVPKKEDKIKSAHTSGKRYAMDSAYYYMAAIYPGAKETFLTPASDSAAPIRILMRYPYSIVRKQNTLYFDQYSGKVLKAELYKNYTGYDNVAKSNYDFHTGRIRVLGIGSKIIYFLVALMAASLPITGFLIWWGKRKKNTKANLRMKQFENLSHRDSLEKMSEV
ncbi:PepSY-associated TM helix domain-containing protein [Chitinophagaceae bacterium LWZ2-11]